MAVMRFKISDGTTTLDLFGGSDAVVKYGGVSLPPPKVRAGFTSNSWSDGALMDFSYYDNRSITINCKIKGTSLADIKANVRAIQQILNDAKNRTLMGASNTYYLEMQWGDSSGESTFFDILRGDLQLPDDWMSLTLESYYHILDAKILLECKPFGRYANTSLSPVTLQNCLNTYKPVDGCDVDDFYNLNFYHDYGANYYAQTFTTTAAYACIGASVKLAKVGAPTNAKLELWSVDGAHKPGSMLKSVTIDLTQLDSTARFYRAIFAAAQSLTTTTEYAIVIYCTGDGSNYLKVFYNSSGGYTGGALCTSADSGSTWSITAYDLSFSVLTASACVNYQAVDVSATTPEPDVASRMYVKIVPTGTSGTKKVWIAKRSANRDTDVLWKEGEEFATFTNIVGGAHTVTPGGVPAPTLSGGGAARVLVLPSGSNIAAYTDLCRFNYTFSSVPVGHFRVLARCYIGVGSTYNDVGFGFGYSYGGYTKAPSQSAGEYYKLAANTTWEILDLGDIVLPPVPASNIATNPSLELRLFINSQAELIDSTTVVIPTIDYIFLLPIDEQCTIVDGVVSTSSLALDGIAEAENVLFLNGSGVVLSRPDSVGRIPKYGREDFRIYVLRDDDPLAVTHACTITYQPNFLTI